MTVRISRRRILANTLVASLIACLALVGAGRAHAAAALYISGAGNGHGIGMSQYGALGYAEHGWRYPAILSHYYTGTSLGHTNPNRDVTVLLAVGSASFSGANGAGASLSNTGSVAARKLAAHTTYSVTARSGRMLELESSGHSVGSFRAPLVVTGSHPLTVEGLGAYRGSLVFWPAQGGGVETVNLVDLEDYVRGVISGEMPPSWPAQALDVQAVAARTFAITDPPESSQFELFSDTRSQVYRGVSAETPSTDAAVLATANQVVTYDGHPVITYFSASSGGHTESIQDAWPGASPEPWLIGVPDPYDDAADDPFYHWAVTLSLRQATGALDGLVKGSLVGIRVTRRGLSPRIVTADVVGTAGTTEVTGPQLEAQFGLMSTDMSFATMSVSNGPGAGLAAAAGAVTGNATADTYAIHGTVFPTPSGSTVQIERRTGRGYAVLVSAGVGVHGDFSVGLPKGGVYRLLDDGIIGPAVVVTAHR